MSLCSVPYVSAQQRLDLSSCCTESMLHVALMTVAYDVAMTMLASFLYPACGSLLASVT